MLSRVQVLRGSSMDIHSTPNPSDAAPWPAPWPASVHAVAVSAQGETAGERRPVILSTHAATPFIGQARGNVLDFDDWVRIAQDYLPALSAVFKDRALPFLPESWMAALGPHGSGLGFSWRPTHAARSPHDRNPVVSRVLERGPDRTIILVAGDPIESGFGVRVVLRVLDETDRLLAITSLAAHLPYGPYETTLVIENNGTDSGPFAYPFTPEDFSKTIDGVLQDNLSNIARDAGQAQDTVRIKDLRLLDPARTGQTGHLFEATTLGLMSHFPHGPEPDPAGQGVAARTRFGFAGTPPQLRARWPLQASALPDGGGPANPVFDVPVFRTDPASNMTLQDPPPYNFGQFRPSGDLNDARATANVPNILRTPQFEIRTCPGFVQQDDGGPADGIRRLNFDPAHPYVARSDDQSAASAFVACRSFFDMIASFGIDVASIFTRAKLPLLVHYRSGIRPGSGKDGRTVNARVEIEPVDGELSDPIIGQVHMYLALANLNKWHRDVPPNGTFAPRPAQPLGIANSRRWVHHEMGHVLIAAALGELEFRFAHSAGDALAAIMADPTSRVNEADPHGPWATFRFQTFPWVFLTRRHDRSVLAGWSWSGSIHMDVLRTPENELRRLKGYHSEQILSTTLFRLYRVIGGDTTIGGTPIGDTPADPDVDRRRKAARVALYLIVRAIDSFGLSPLRVDELESAMIDADVGLTSPLGSALGDIWIGGLGHKVIRWAFEAQGLHPADPARINNDKGAPPEVDLYIDDRRPKVEPTDAGDVIHGPGTYVPVSLHWAQDAQWLGAPTGDKHFVLGNRGTQPATGVTLRAWRGHLAGATIVWHPIAIATPAAANGVAPGARIALPLPAIIDAAIVRLLLVEVTAPGDPANSDPATGFACAIPAGGLPPGDHDKLTALVANDNNLGLFWL
ncbi:MAG: hypothetical protein CML66_26130 [Rhodobacteraceae bacterium]|nr:hypothetical protein [Paracoccaceae bacterium]